MITTGIRDLKARLRKYLEAVRGGEEIVVTDRGRPVARIIKERLRSSSTAQQLASLASTGAVTLPKESRKDARPDPVPVGGRQMSDLVSEDRR